MGTNVKGQGKISILQRISVYYSIPFIFVFWLRGFLSSIEVQPMLH